MDSSSTLQHEHTRRNSLMQRRTSLSLWKQPIDEGNEPSDTNITNQESGRRFSELKRNSIPELTSSSPPRSRRTSIISGNNSAGDDTKKRQPRRTSITYYAKHLRKANMAPLSQPSSSRSLPAELMVLPNEPRLCAMLSPDGQYAIMKGYEEKIYQELTELYPEYADAVVHTKMPNKVTVSIKDEYLLDGNDAKSKASQNSQDKWYTEDSVDAGGWGADKATNGEHIFKKIPVPQSVQDQYASRQMSSMNTSRRLAISRDLKIAQKILDNIHAYKNPNDRNIFDSNRLSNLIRNPIDEFNEWSNLWTTQFEIRSLT